MDCWMYPMWVTTFIRVCLCIVTLVDMDAHFLTLPYVALLGAA